MQNIQDCTHLVIVIGVFSGIALLLQAAIGIVATGVDCFVEKHLLGCAGELLTVCFCLLFVCYMNTVISQYDEQLMAKEEACKEQKAKLMKSYDELLSDMDGLLGNAAESASGLAERSFESKRRDFQRFLERAKSRFGGHTGDQEMLNQFRRFCINWLIVFRECSIDPVNNPVIVVTEEELARQSSIEEIADMCLERLRQTEVRFMSVQRDEDKKFLTTEGQRNLIRGDPRVGQIPADGLPLANAVPLAIGNGDTYNPGNVGGPPQSGSGMAALMNKPVKERRMTWIKCGGGFHYKCQDFPVQIGLGCISVTILSKQHSTLLMSFFLGCCILGLKLHMFLTKGGFEEPDSNLLVSLVLLILTQMCSLVVLINFESIDLVQKLEREVQDLKNQNEHVSVQRNKMKEFWTNAQNLTELWLYRTVPRLDLYKEVHSQLEDEHEEENLLTHISGANDALENMEKRLGALADWRNDGKLTLEAKKHFGKTVNELCQIGDFSDLLESIQDDVIKGSAMKALANLTPQKPTLQ